MNVAEPRNWFDKVSEFLLNEEVAMNEPQGMVRAFSDGDYVHEISYDQAAEACIVPEVFTCHLERNFFPDKESIRDELYRWKHGDMNIILSDEDVEKILDTVGHTKESREVLIARS